MNTKNDPKKLVGEVQIFRIRLATAESKLKLLRDQARQARRRRKEAKRTAQRARKQFKRFKAELADLRQAMAKAEVRLFRAGGRTLARKLKKTRPNAKRRTLSSKKSRPVVRKLWPDSPRKSSESRSIARKKTPVEEAKVVSEVPTDVVTLDPVSLIPQILGLNS